MIEVARYLDRPEAELARSRLEAAGIRTIVSTDNEGGMAPHLSYLTGVRVLVPAGDVAAARELLQSHHAPIDEQALEAEALAHGPGTEVDDGKGNRKARLGLQRSLGLIMVLLFVVPIVMAVLGMLGRSFRGP